MVAAPGPFFIASAPIIGSLMENLLHRDNPPEAEKLARELRKRLDTARDVVEQWSEYAGLAEHARLRAEMEKGKERRKWERRAARFNAKAQGYRAGLDVIYGELAMFAPPGMQGKSEHPDTDDPGLPEARV